MTTTDERLREMAKQLHRKVSHTVSHKSCISCQDAIFQALQQVRRETLEEAVKVADEMDTTVTLDCPCGLSTSVPCSRRHIASAIRKLNGEGGRP